MIKIIEDVFSNSYLQELSIKFFSDKNLQLSLNEEEIKNELFYKIMKSCLFEYCFEKNIEMNNLKLSVSHAITIENYLNSSDNIYFEPHHDIKEGIDVVTLLYVDYDENSVGGQTVFYHDFSSVNYPNNQTIVDMQRGKVVIFPSDIVHRIKPYFGEKTRRTISLGWRL
jgi:predicted 2-oxoglutarate/Fe(II)-dependent dioxygenase YbiX